MTLVKTVLDGLDFSATDAAMPFHIAIGPVGVTVLCAGGLRDELMAYFAEALVETLAPELAHQTVHLLPDQGLTWEPDWIQWAREGGKTGRKDAVFDLDGARLVRKVRSGVTFLQSPDHAIAFGPLQDNVSTVINFINTQVLNICQRDGWQLCHAAAVTGLGRGLAIAGLSGGGKSTSILRMMDIEGMRFVSNDRVLVAAGAEPRALGIPKHPRINPGTILGNPRLRDMIAPARRAELEAMPVADLWALEEKHDLFIGEVYGPDRVQYAAPLTDFWVLNWSHEADTPVAVTEVDLSARPDLLSAIMKSPGPFYQHPDGRFEPNGASPDPAPYLDALQDVRVCEVSGRIDFDALAGIGQQLFAGSL